MSLSLSRKNDKIFVGLVALTFLFFLGASFLWYCHSTIENHLEKAKWSMPSVLYAQGPILSSGSPMQRAELIEYLEKLDYHRETASDGPLRAGEYMVLPGAVKLKKRQLFLTEKEQSPVRVEFGSLGIRSVAQADNGTVLSSYELEPIPIKYFFGERWEKRTIVFLKDIPVPLMKAVLATEDRRFFDHKGIDWQAIGRAVWKNIKEKKVMEGGSTLTQQLAKNFYLSPERSFRRKLSEAIMALMLEEKLNKKDILELYLNEVYLGQRGPVGMHGVGEASRFYFGKDVQYLTVPECALLAGMIRAPNLYNPYRHPKEARDRRDTVLAAMRDLNMITRSQYKQYSSTPIRLSEPDRIDNVAPYFSDLTKAQLSEKYDQETLGTKNMRIFTTLDLQMQRQAERILHEGLNRIDREHNRADDKKVQGSLIAIEPQTGYIRAFVGGGDYSKSQFDRISKASRQPGSVFKPVVYAAALERAFGHSGLKKVFTPATLLKDEPWTLQYGDKVWEPKNYDSKFHGDVNLRTALTYSMNVATARLASEIGFDEIADLGNRLGFRNLRAYPSIALGSFEASPWEVARAYGVFASGGLQRELLSIRRVASAEGETLEKFDTQPKRILHSETAFIITDMLRSVVYQGTGAAVRSRGFVKPAAGKTGTTDDFRDAWFVGYVPQLLCVVWVGYDDNSPLNMSGAEAALPIWVDFMKEATRDMPEKNFPVPPLLTLRRIDPYTGQLGSPYCPAVIPELFIQGTEPQEICTQHQPTRYAFSRSYSAPVQRFTRRYLTRERPNVLKKLGRKLKNIFD